MQLTARACGAFACFWYAASGGSAPAADSTMLQQSFAGGRSTQVEYARNREGQTFYVALRATSLAEGLDSSKCVDSGFISWVRKFFYKDGRTTVLTIDVTGPGEGAGSVRTIPLFQVSRDESTSPPTCLSDIQTDIQITPFYVADQNSTFTITSQMVSSKQMSVTGAQSIVSAATDLLSYAKGSPSAVLTEMIAKGSLVSAAGKIDESIKDNAAERSTEEYKFSLAPWPVSGDWSQHEDEKVFSAKSIVAKSTGVTLDTSAVPAMRVEMVYRESLLGGGAGHYLPPGKILLVQLVNKDDGNLESILSAGLDGVKTSQAMAIVDASAMRSLCDNLHLTLDKFLSNDDSLAARYAVLGSETNIFRAPVLKDAVSACFSDSDLGRLPQLSSSFKVSYPRTEFRDRSKAVDSQSRFLAKALGHPSKSSLGLAGSADIGSFQVDLPEGVSGVFPIDGKQSRLKGAEAVAFLKDSGGFRVACARALPQLSTANIAMMAQNIKTNKSIGIYVQFANGDVRASAGARVAPTISARRISFYDVETLQQLLSLPDWPDAETCPFAS